MVCALPVRERDAIYESAIGVTWERVAMREPGGVLDGGRFSVDPHDSANSYGAVLGRYATVPRIHAIVRDLLRTRKGAK